MQGLRFGGVARSQLPEGLPGHGGLDFVVRTMAAERFEQRNAARFAFLQAPLAVNGWQGLYPGCATQSPK